MAQVYRTQAEIIKKNKEKEEEMTFSIKARCKDGELLYLRKTSEAALKKARVAAFVIGTVDQDATNPILAFRRT